MGHIHETAEVEEGALVDQSALVWGLAQVRKGAAVGPGTTIGRGAYVGAGVSVGAYVKVQNYALLYGAVIDDWAFIGPAAVLTNDLRPRATLPDGRLKSATDWTAVSVHVKRGASVGARAVCVAPVIVGEWALVGAGSVVTSDVPAYAVVVGAPARQVGWVGRTGQRLVASSDVGTWSCPETADRFRETSSGLVRISEVS